MQIFNLSHLFKTPVLSAAETNPANKKSRRRRRKKRTQNADCVQTASDSSKRDDAVVGAKSFRPRSPPNVRPETTRKYKGAYSCPAAPVKATRGTTTEPTSSATNEVETKIAATMKQEMVDLIGSLQTLASEKDALEKNVNELREENDRLIKNNEDLKDELKEMTDEALELTVEKQRLLSKIGVLKKQLLNRPK